MDLQAPDHSGSEAARRVAVLVRTHVVDGKLFDLLACLAGGRGYDLYVAANETNGPLRVGPYRKISHTLDDVRALGFDLPNERSLLHYSDQVFYVLQQKQPDYDFYIMIENDVHLTRGNASFMEALIEKLASGPDRELDLVATACGHRGPAWDFHESCSRVFPDVYGVFFPFVGLSKRALVALHDRRLQELAESPARQDLVYCEAFVPSALAEAGTYRIADLNDVIPGCYSGRSFRLNTEPFFIEEARGENQSIELMHPVYTAREFLERGFVKAYWAGTLERFQEDLKNRWPAVPVDVRRHFLARVEESLLKEWYLSQLKEAERLKTGFFDPELARLNALLQEAARPMPEQFERELARLHAQLAEAERVKKEFFEPELERLHLQLAAAERVTKEFFEPELARLTARLAEVERMRPDLSEPELDRDGHAGASDRDGPRLPASGLERSQGSPTRRVAVMVRTHVVNPKVLDLLDSLSPGRGYDLYVAVNETRGEIDLRGYAKLSHTLDDIRALGFDLADERSMLHYSDQVFFYLQTQIPNYDFYILVEDDVHFVRNGPEFMEALVEKLASAEYGDADLVSTKCEWGWHESGWYPAAREAFAQVHSIFFPFVGLSKRAILRLHERRLEEAREGTHKRQPVYCEMFVPSALVEAGGFRIVDLNQMFPGCYQRDSFGFGVRPQILEDACGDDEAVELLHPVYTAREFLERLYARADWGGALEVFLKDLEGKWPSVPADLRAEFVARAEDALFARRPEAAE